MTKLFLDTNVWVRYLIKDEPKQFVTVKNLLALVEEGKYQPYISSIVLLELSYVLKSVYSFAFSEIVDALESVVAVREITIIEATNSALALAFFKTHKIKFTDCLLASQIRKDIILVTFDEELRKIKKLTIKTPEEVSKHFPATK